MTRLRIGVLGAARIAPAGLLRPAKQVDEVTVTTVAARDPARAERMARAQDLVVRPTYDALIEDPDLDAVYVPLPNGLHGRWSIRALGAGKHVLCEKPLAANAEEAAQMAETAARTDRVLMEAFHYRYHPLADRMAEIVHGGEIGEIRSVATWMCFPLPRFGDIRYRADLAGGALMDAGCYAVHCLRLLGPGPPTVTAARAARRGPDVDRAMSISLRFPGGATGQVETSMWSHRVLHIAARVEGSTGRLSVVNFVAPHLWHLVTLRTGRVTRRFRVPGEATYVGQLRAFAAGVAGTAPVATPASDAVTTMGLIDAAYVAAGLEPRAPTPA